VCIVAGAVVLGFRNSTTLVAVALVICVAASFAVACLVASGDGGGDGVVGQLCRIRRADRSRCRFGARFGARETVGAAMLFRSVATRWLARERPSIATIALNARIMTIFLWNMTAYLLAILILWPLGFGHDREPTVRWWLERPLWLAAAGVVLYSMVTVFGPLERPSRPRRTATREQVS
jgi:hypothetical protein